MGNGQTIASSYNSRDVDLALGRDFAADQRVEFHALRLDQTGVELPGQAFDIEWRGTDAYEVTYTADCPTFADRLLLGSYVGLSGMRTANHRARPALHQARAERDHQRTNRIQLLARRKLTDWA